MMMFSTICKAVILFLLVCYFILRFRRKRLERLIDQFSGPPAYPLFGNINIATGSSSMILKKMMDMALTYRSPCAMWFFHKPHLIIYDPENFQIVMNKALNKGRLVGFLKQLLGNGLITIDDQEIWKKHRRQLNPAVSLKLMGRYYLKIFHCMNRTLVKEMNAFANTGEKINLWNFISERENRRIIRTMTDHNTETEEGAADSAKFWKGMRKGFWSVIRRMHSPLLYPQEINRLFTQIIGGSATFEGVRELPQKIIDNRRAQMRNIADNNAESKDEFFNPTIHTKSSEQLPETHS